MKSFILAVQFMTRIPIPVNMDIKREDFQKTVRFFPIVGLIIGLSEALIYYISCQYLSIMLTAFAVVLTHIIITGAMHIDGLGDTADGIFSGRSTDKILDIMKDSRLGTFGALAIIVVVVGKIIMISSLSEKYVLMVIILAPVISRTMNIFLMYKRKYARNTQGMGDLFIGTLKIENAIIAFILASVLIVSIGKLYGIVMFIVGFVFTILFRSYIESKIGGITGDILGASDELNEILIYLIMCINVM